MSQNNRRKAQPAAKSRVWLILLAVGVMALALVGGMQARNLLPNGIDLTALRGMLPELPPSSGEVVQSAVTAYAQNGDVEQARQALAGLGDAEVAKQLTQMEMNATDTATRQQVSQLRQALSLPVVEPSAADLVLGEQSVWLTLALAAVPLGAALVLGLGSSVRTMVKARLEESRVARARAAARSAAQAEAAQPEPEQPAEPDAAQVAEAGGAQAAPAEAVVVKAKPAPEKPPSSLVSAAGPDPMGGGEANESIQGILADVFGDENQQTRRTVLLQGLGDIPAQQLLAACRQVADGLRMNWNGVRHPAGSNGARKS